MKRINKIISLLLTLMMLLSLCSFTAIAEDGNGQTDDKQGEGAETVSSTNDLPDIGGVDVTNDTTEFRVTPSSDSITITTTITTDPAEPSNPVKQGNVTIKADIIAPVDYGLYEENNTSDNLKVTVAGSIDSSSGIVSPLRSISDTASGSAFISGMWITLWGCSISSPTTRAYRRMSVWRCSDGGGPATNTKRTTT